MGKDRMSMVMVGIKKQNSNCYAKSSKNITLTQQRTTKQCGQTIYFGF